MKETYDQKPGDIEWVFRHGKLDAQAEAMKRRYGETFAAGLTLLDAAEVTIARARRDGASDAQLSETLLLMIAAWGQANAGRWVQ